MQDLERILDEALDNSTSMEDLCLVSRDAVIALRDLLRSQRHAQEYAEEKLTPTQLRIYNYLAANRGRVVLSVELMQAADLPSLTSLRVQVANMRHRAPGIGIDNHPGKGYGLKAVDNG